MLRISQKKMQQQIRTLTAQKIPFTYKVTNQRQIIYSPIGNYMNKESQFPSKELNFIKQVKKHVIKNQIYKKIPNRFKKVGSKNKIKYFHYNRKYHAGSIVNNVFEVDLRSAYWETCYKMGIITEEIYLKGKSVSKKSRLAAVGSLAKKEDVYEFDGENEIKLPDEMDPEKRPELLTEFLWDTICHKVGKLMSKVARECKSDFIFFWVDAMFVHKNSLEKVKQIFREAGYEFSVERCKYIQFNNKDLIVEGKGKWGEIDGEKAWITKRPFPYKNALTEIEIMNLAASQ
jgi:hypothetical protein